MGIVAKETISNSITTFFGFAVGAVNVLFLYTNILEAEYYGLVTLILATGTLLMPMLTFGMQNALVKYYKDPNINDKSAFLGFMLWAPILVILPLSIVFSIFQTQIGEWLSIENTIVKDYLWYIFLVGIAMAYFEIFYSWCKVHLKTSFGNFMKEVFHRVCISVLLMLLYLEVIFLPTFLIAIVAVYWIRTLIVMGYAFSIETPTKLGSLPNNYKGILNYGLIMLIGTSVAVWIVEVDKVMINQFKSLENLAYYSVAIFMARVIYIPYRSMNQITFPLTAKFLNGGEYEKLSSLYRKNSLTSFMACGLIFVLILANCQDLFLLLPEKYRGGFWIVTIVGLAYISEVIIGNTNAILYYSEHYRITLVLGVLAAVAIVVLNMILIPIYGIVGAAMAILGSMLFYNISKVLLVKKHFGFWPFDLHYFKVFLLLVVLGLGMLYLDLPWHPLVNISLKGIVMCLLYYLGTKKMGLLSDFDFLRTSRKK